jgi:hypothetical protein
MFNVRHFIVMFAAAAFVAGCSSTKEVAKSSKQLLRGEQGTVVAQSPQQVAQAVDQAIAGLKLIRIGATTRPSKEQTETVVIARNTSDAKVTIAFRATGRDAGKTRVAVTTGPMGNSDLRDQVWDAVRIQLGVITATAAQANEPATAVQVTANPAPATQPTAATSESASTSATAATAAE